MSFFIEPAMAEGAAAPGGDTSSLVIMMVIFAAVFYFMIWRPQAKRTKDHKNLMGGLSKGDEVVTNGGIVGKVTAVEESFATLEIAQNVLVKVQKQGINQKLPKGSTKI